MRVLTRDQARSETAKATADVPVSIETQKRIFRAKRMEVERRLWYTDAINRGRGTKMLEFIAANLPILICLVVGIALIVLEAFMPGFGLPGISGIILQVAAVTLTWLSHGPVAALGMTLIILSIDAIAISVSLRSAANGKLSRSKIILKDTESNEAGYRSTEDMEVFLGKEGTTTTVLRPTGMAEFDGVRLNVVSEGEFIQAGMKVRIVRVEGSRVLVRTIG